jgi:predicted ATPase with chaperone activity
MLAQSSKAGQAPGRSRETLHDDKGVMSSLLREWKFHPAEPSNVQETGLSQALLEALVCKRLLSVGVETGRNIAEFLALPLGVLQDVFQRLRSRQLIVHKSSAPLGDYFYALSEEGRGFAQLQMNACAYLGPAPVPLTDYVTSVDAQTIRAEAPKRQQLQEACEGISVNPAMFARLGPAVNSGAGLFLYGAPGNGKTTLAERITLCFGHQIWIPQAIWAEGEIIKLYDPAYHRMIGGAASSILREDCHDKRWVHIRRPTVVVGGELTMDSLEIRHNADANVSEAPLQLKSNCGSLLIDDFGRQRMNPMELLNRWIVPLEKHHDYLTLASGKKIEVPFDQLIIFSTNLEPHDLVDEAFLRRIPYKINVPDPDAAEFHELFRLCAPSLGCEYRPRVIDYLLEKHYRASGRQLRRCHPRDLLMQIRNYCAYHDLPLEVKEQYFDEAVANYFTVMYQP